MCQKSSMGQPNNGCKILNNDPIIREKQNKKQKHAIVEFRFFDVQHIKVPRRVRVEKSCWT